MSRQYYGIEDLGLSAGQRQTLIDALKKLGRNYDPNPAYRNHWRTRNDGMAVIFEGDFIDDDWDVSTLVARLANLFDADPAAIDTSTAASAHGPIVTFAAGGSDRLRLIAFGGHPTTWEHSHEHVIDYLTANIDDWESVSE